MYLFGLVAVGMPVTRHPPHRSRRAALPHRAPASSDDAQAQSTCRTQSCACGRVSRRCVRPLWYSTRFPLASPLLSTPSASSSALEPLFVGCIDTMGLSDSRHPSITGVSQRGSPGGPGMTSPGQMQGLPGSAQRVSVHARGLRPRRVWRHLATTASPVSPSACSERVGTQE
jgi:hypothetical protein